MATYYVRPDGNDSNSGLGSTTALAWRTIQKALGATGIGSGDTVYIAPGHYNESVTVGGTYSAETQVIGDPTASQFIGVNPGYVKHSAFPATGNTTNNFTSLFVAVSKNYLHFKNIYWEYASFAGNPWTMTNARFTKLTSCVFVNNKRDTNNAVDVALAGETSLTTNTIITNCLFYGHRIVSITGGGISDNSSITNSLFVYSTTESLRLNTITMSLYNSIFYGGVTGIQNNSGSTTTMRNCLVSLFTTAITNAGTMNQDYSRFIGNLSNISNTGTYTAGANSVTAGIMGVEFGYSLLHNLVNQVIFGSLPNSPNTSFGTTSGAPVTDMFGVAWSGTSPDAGAITNRSIGAVSQYLPTERNSSAITVAPGDTSRSLYLYLGATGLTHTTTNLTASYTRNGQASVPITLVAQTPTGSYISGGFCEVSAPYARGTYRLDVPNAAFDFGADDVTIFVGGTNTTNGAVVTCNMQGIAGNIVHIGPFKVIGDGLGSDQPLDIVQGVQAPVSVQLVDANENGVDISGATVEAKVYNAIGSLIATYSCVPVYAADGRCTFQLTTSVTNTAGVYNVTLTRTIGGNIVVFGPMKMIVRAN